MAVHRSSRGLTLPVAGEPELMVDSPSRPGRVALLGDDYPGMRPTIFVKVGDEVRTGSLLFEDKRNPGVRFTSPGSGRVSAIHRGERRVFRSMVIELSGGESSISFGAYTGKHPSSLSRTEITELLLESGEWTALRARPFGGVASPATKPHSIFVTAMDTNPLAAPSDALLSGAEADFERGLAALAKLTEGAIFVCTAEPSRVPVPSEQPFRHERFRGPHPAGTVGYHIHVLDPVDRNKTVWHIGLQDVVAIGRLFERGELDLSRLVSFAGPKVQRPRLLKTRRGAFLDELVEGELHPGDSRIISGSVLSGRRAMGDAAGYLGRYHQQVSVIAEDRERVFLG
ncbi:MAG TPA: NADH:ubiquinone reductase (Na(+)-transporting) subunit A, partial [Vicinamibacteria bacterium]|nr:NADH:ubiquinone reductase (Na(+)-transporting) subunit A [Vicinamibacteria bacterium]